MKRTQVLFLWCTLFIVGPSESSVIRIDDGGYSNVLVAVHSNIAEHKDILENLKGLLRNTSAFLYNATRGLAYFREITIVIPENWTHHEVSRIVNSNLFGQAHIRIDLENEFYGPEPFTRHFRDCGEQGEFIQLTPNYLQSLSSPTARNAFGIPERRLTHEWAHFRYGIFDEHPMRGDKNYPSYYRDGNKVVPNTCSHDIGEASYFETSDGKECDPRELGDKCLLQTYSSSVQATASLMYSTSIPSVTSFCDDSEERRHNRKALTKQNVKCKYKSTWEVISSHKDFNVKRKSTHQPNTSPKFTIVRQSSSAGRCVMVLDISGSMDGEPIKLLHEAASRFISDQVPDGISLGVATFGSEAKIKQSLTIVNNATRKTLVDSLPNLANGGGTAIGKGLLKGLQTLEANKNQSVEGSVILLITDGEETDAPFINDSSVLPKLVEKKVVVKTIAYGKKASEMLTNLTTATGGQGFFFESIHDANANSKDLDSSFMEALTLQSDVEFEPVQITSKNLNLYLQESTFTTIVDQELGRNTLFTVTSPGLDNIIVELRSPSNRLYTHQSPEYNKNTNLKRISFRFQDSEVGKWMMTVKRIGNNPVNITFSAKSEPKSSIIHPVRIKSFLSGVVVPQPPTMKIYAQVTKNNLPVIKAQVLAIVLTPKQKSHGIILRDNGKGADLAKNDGLYTGFFTKFDSKGRYSVSALVSGLKKARVLRLKKNRREVTAQRNRRSADEDGTWTNIPLYEVYEYETDFEEDEDTIYEEEPIGDFERSANVGEFKVEEWIEDAGDVIPPVRVSDLNVVGVDVMEDDKKIVTIRWTSPGDDEDNGNASSIELRASTSFDQLLTNFNNATELDSSYVLEGSLIPQPANDIQSVTLGLPVNFLSVNDSFDSIYFALRAVDESENFGDLSNIAVAHFADLRPVPHSTGGGGNDEDGLHPGIIIILVVVSGAILLAILMLTLSRRKKRSYTPVVLA